MYKNCNYNKEALIKILEKYDNIDGCMHLLNLIINAYSNIQRIEIYLKKEKIIYNKINDICDITNNTTYIMYLYELTDTDMLKLLTIWPNLMQEVINDPMYAFDKFYFIKNTKLTVLYYHTPLIHIKHIYENEFSDECNICFENTTVSVICKCSYTFCIECLKKLKECPICKIKLDINIKLLL